MAQSRQVRVNVGEINRILQSRSGPVDPFMRRVQGLVRDRARQLAPKKTGRGAASIFSRPPQKLGGEMVYFVGTEVDYMFWQQEGSPPHRITGKPKLVFVWPKIAGQGYGPGRTIFITPSKRWRRGYVNNPGISLNPSAGNRGVTPYLTQAREEVIEREVNRR